jgi:hypothetical protein
MLCSHENCTQEVPVEYNRTEVFTGPISYVIKTARSYVHSNDMAPPRWYKLGRKWCCSHKLWECRDPAVLPVEDMHIETLLMSDICLEKSIYT